MAIRNREYGAEQPYIPAGIFKIRLPLVHYRWEWPEFFQGLVLCATCLGAIPVLTETLGIPFEIAVSMVIINGILYNLHVLLGDPVVPGWITPAIPLVVAYLNKYPLGPERYQALIALQLMLGIWFIIMGVSGVAHKLVEKVPISIKAGILLGSGVAAVISEVKLGGRIEKYPISIIVGMLISYYLIFSSHFLKLKREKGWARTIGSLGMLPALVVALVIGPLVREVPVPQIQFKPLIIIPDVGGILKTVGFIGAGFPSIDKFVAAVPMMFVAYIIAFGDFITAHSLVTDANKVRPDEKIDFNINRSNIISGLRNTVQSFIAPYVTLCGPLWAAVTATVAERYRDGRESMDSIFSGAGTFRIATTIGVATMPIVSLLKPVLPIALSLTLLIQGYVCTRIAMNYAQTDVEKGIAGVMGAVLATRGAAWGLAVGIVLHLLLERKWGKEEELKK